MDKGIKVFRWVVSLAVLGIAPYVAFLVARFYDPGAYLLGPYLLVSPLIAILIAGTVFARLFRVAEAVSDFSEYLSVRASNLAQKAGLTSDSVFLYEDPSERAAPVTTRGNQIWVNRAVWNNLDADQQEFALATEIARMAQGKEMRAGKGVMWSTWVLAGGFFAALNPWLVIPIHTGTAVAFAWELRMRVLQQDFMLDSAALSMTGDLAGAESFLRWQKKYKGDVGLVTYEQRIEALREANSAER